MKAHRSEGFPLSPQQGRLWRLEETGGPFVAVAAVQIDGELDSQWLRQSLGQLTRQHSILRTTFQNPSASPDSGPLQVVADEIEPGWQEIDWTGLETERQKIHLQQLLGCLRQQPFDLAKGPVLEVRLIAFSQCRHALLLRLPSLCSDAWTLRNLLGQICGAADSESLETLEYGKFALWQHELRQGEFATQAEEFWKKHSPDDSAAGIPLRQGGASNGFEVRVGK